MSSTNPITRPHCGTTTLGIKLRPMRNHTKTLTLPARLDNGSVLSWVSKSRFLNSIFPLNESTAQDHDRSNAGSKDASNISEHWKPRPLIRHEVPSGKSQPTPSSLPPLPPPRTRHLHMQRRVTYYNHARNFSARNAGDKVRFKNRYALFTLPRHNNIVPLGVSFDIPDGCFGLTCYSVRDPNFMCPVDLTEQRDRDPEVQIVNLADTEQRIESRKITGFFFVFPLFMPEPWELVNMDPARTGSTFFELRLRKPLNLQARATTSLTLDVAHICGDECCAIVTGTKHLNRIGLLLEPLIWRSGTVPTLRLVNTTTMPARLTTNTPIAHAVFTIFGFGTANAFMKPVSQIICPPASVSFHEKPNNKNTKPNVP